MAMKKATLSVLAAVVLAFAVEASFGAGVNMKEGKWETTVQMKMEGLPFPMPPITFKTSQCLTQKDLVPNTAGKNQSCKMTDQKISGDTITYKVTCAEKDGSTSTGEGKITYSGSSFQGTVKTTVTDKAGNTTSSSSMTLNGRRVGDCDK